MGKEGKREVGRGVEGRGGGGGCVKNTDPKGQKQEMTEIWKEERLTLEVTQLAHAPPARRASRITRHVLLLHGKLG
jgi:hypothetical protein